MGIPMASAQTRNGMSIILASGSPRRRQLLQRITPDFDVVVPHIEEDSSESLPERVVIDIASQKARTVSALDTNIVLGVDTAICLEGEVLGKPRDRDDALSMLKPAAPGTRIPGLV